jgi:uncharacterized protein (TIGR02118 family)
MGDIVKLVFCVRRRADVPVDEFHRYWRDEHGPLVKAMSEHIPMVRYVQSHLLRGEHTDLVTASRGAAEPYDGIAEVWFDGDQLGAEATADQVMANIRLLEDERTFIDLERSAVFFTTEHEVFGPD